MPTEVMLSVSNKDFNFLIVLFIYLFVCLFIYFFVKNMYFSVKLFIDSLYLFVIFVNHIDLF